MQSDYTAGNAYTNGTSDGGGNDAWSHLPAMQKQIMQIIQNDQSEEGLHVSTISKQVKSGSSEQVM